MNETQGSLVFYVFLVIAAVFMLGYLAGYNIKSPERCVSKVTDIPTISRLVESSYSCDNPAQKMTVEDIDGGKRVLCTCKDPHERLPRKTPL